MTSTQAFCEKQNLFEARTHGYHTVRIPGMLVTKRGVVLVTGEARRGRGGDYDNNDVLLRRSTDGGKTFAPFKVIVSSPDYGPGPCSNFVMVNDDASGDVHAVFCHDYNRVYHIVSHDDGETFSAPEEIMSACDAFKADYDWAVIATGPAHGTQLRNGRMIFPLWMSDGSGSEFGPEHRGHRPSVVSMLYSDDHGTTWQAGEIVARHGENDIINPSETIMVELADGSVLFNMRSESKKRRRLTAISPDGVSNWSAPTFDEALLEPVCMASLLRISWPEDGEGRILFANPDNLENDLIRPGGALAHDRKRLTVKLSRDDGRSWPVSKVLEAGPSGYSDLAMLADNTILCLYENELVEKMCDDKYLTLARFNMEWLLDAEG